MLNSLNQDVTNHLMALLYYIVSAHDFFDMMPCKHTAIFNEYNDK